MLSLSLLEALRVGAAAGDLPGREAEQERVGGPKWWRLVHELPTSTGTPEGFSS